MSHSLWPIGYVTNHMSHSFDTYVLKNCKLYSIAYRLQLMGHKKRQSISCVIYYEPSIHVKHLNIINVWLKIRLTSPPDLDFQSAFSLKPQLLDSVCTSSTPYRLQLIEFVIKAEALKWLNRFIWVHVRKIIRWSVFVAIFGHLMVI